MIPPFPFRRDSLVADEYLFFLFPSVFNFDNLHTLVSVFLVEWNYLFSSKSAFIPIKKARKEVV